MADQELVTMTRGGADIAVVRPEWVDEWKGYGYRVVTPKPAKKEK